jgi:hypothetical protein
MSNTYVQHDGSYFCPVHTPVNCPLHVCVYIPAHFTAPVRVWNQILYIFIANNTYACALAPVTSSPTKSYSPSTWLLRLLLHVHYVHRSIHHSPFSKMSFYFGKMWFSQKPPTLSFFVFNSQSLFFEYRCRLFITPSFHSLPSIQKYLFTPPSKIVHSSLYFRAGQFIFFCAYIHPTHH